MSDKLNTDYKPLGDGWAGKLFGIPPVPKKNYPVYEAKQWNLAQTPDFRKVVASGEILLGAVSLVPSPANVRIAALAGFDFLFLDWEHSPMSIGEVTELVRSIYYASEGRCAGIVRMPNHDHHYIAWTLDAGAAGIVLPHTETVEEAKNAVKHARFANFPTGVRSFPPAALYAGLNDGGPEGSTPMDTWNKAAVIIQIESVLGAENADAIAAVEGVDALMIGQGDLQLDILPRVASPADVPAEMGRCLKLIYEASKKHKKYIFGFSPDPSKLDEMLANNYRGMMIGFDLMAMAVSYRNALSAGWEAKKAFMDKEAAGQ